MDNAARTVFRLSGNDRVAFLQNLVTNDVERLSGGLVWTGLLTPQGKYLADFFLVPDGDHILLDVAAELAAGLHQRLSMYKLRADVEIEPTDIIPSRGISPTSEGAFADPRHESLGWRAYDGRPDEEVDWTAVRVAACVPETGIELIPNESYPLEVRFAELNGVDFKKGCYVGQEVTARMHHKTTLKKGLRRVGISNAVPVSTDITNVSGKAVGTVFSQANGEAIAYLRFDRITDDIMAGDAKVTVLD